MAELPPAAALARLIEREGTGISWADLTFNPWIGCTKVSPACDNCYAETLATNRLGIAWGPHADRHRTAASTWAKPRRWNRIAADAGVQLRVFCASLADVFDNQVPSEWRADLWQLIEATPNLTWMLLTKRPQNVAKMIPPNWLTDIEFAPANIAIGITGEDQHHLDQRYGALHALYPLFDRWPLFLSAEPLRGPLSLTRIGFYVDQIDGGHSGGDDRFDASLTWSNGLTGELWGDDRHPDGRENGRPELGGRGEPKFALVIAGGESGPNARPGHPVWFRQLRDQCGAAGVPFHFKQWGEWGLVKTTGHGDPRYPADPPFGERMERLGTKRAGRLLDGMIHDARIGEAR